MKKEFGRDMVFVLYILTVLALVIIYFSVPERVLFIENALKWWREFRDVIITFLK